MVGLSNQSTDLLLTRPSTGSETERIEHSRYSAFGLVGDGRIANLGGWVREWSLMDEGLLDTGFRRYDGWRQVGCVGAGRMGGDGRTGGR